MRLRVCGLERRVRYHDIMEWLVNHFSVTFPLDEARDMRTNVAIFPLSSEKGFQLPHEHALFVLFYPALPGTPTGADKYLFSISRHGAIYVLLSFDIQAWRRLSTLACWNWTSFNHRNWRRCRWHIDS